MSQEFNKYAKLDGMATRIEMHVSRALLIDSIRTDEADNVNAEKSEEWVVRYALSQTTKFSEVICDYLFTLQEDAEKLRSLVNELLDSRRTDLKNEKEAKPS